MTAAAATFGASEDFSLEGVLGEVREALGKAGIDFEACCKPEKDGEGDCCGVKVVAIAPNLSESAEEMACCARDQVVMVRLDSESAEKLDAWVETGAVNSRSEAAALFIREGLKVRASELERLNDALEEVRSAKNRLRDAAKDAFGK